MQCLQSGKSMLSLPHETRGSTHIYPAYDHYDASIEAVQKKASHDKSYM